MSEGKYRLDVTRINAQTLGIAAYKAGKDGMWQHLATFPTADEAQAFINAEKQQRLEAKRKGARETMLRRHQRRRDPSRAAGT